MNGYYYGVLWIAQNDEPLCRDKEQISDYISTSLLADLFNKDTSEVAADILMIRENKLGVRMGRQLNKLGYKYKREYYND